MFKDIIQTIFFLIVSPRKGWKQIIDKEVSHQDFINNFLFPIFGFVAITTFVGGMWLAENSGIHWALKLSIAVVTALFGGLNELFPKFGLDKKLNKAQQFAGYSSVVLYVLFFVMPLLSEFTLLWLVVIYTIYIVYAGADEFLRIAENKRVSFTVIASLLVVLLPLIIKILLELLVKQTV